MKKNRTKRPVSTQFNDPQKGFDTTSKRTVFILLIVIVAVMAGTYFYINHRYGSLSNMFIGQTTQTTTQETGKEIEIKNMEGIKNTLIAVVSPGESEIYNILMVGINMSENKTYFLSVPLNTKDAAGKTLEEEFLLGGVSQVEYVLERLFEIDFDNYLCATQNAYKFFLTEMGKGVEFNIPENLQFSTTNYTVSLNAGEQLLDFDSFVKLMRYDGWSGSPETSDTRRAELLQALYEQYFRQKYITRDADKFTYKMTYIKSDISSEDYVNDLDALEYIAATDFSCTVLTPQGEFQTEKAQNIFTFSQDGIEEVHAAFTLAPVQE